MSKKPFFFRIDAAGLLDFATDHESEGVTLLKFAKDLVKGESDIKYIQSIIDEANQFIENKRNAGRLGGLAKASTAKAMPSTAKAMPSTALAKPSTPLARSSSSSSKEQPPYSPPNGDELFDRFWSEYPKKVGKEAARKSWKKIKPSQKKTDEIIEALQWQKKSTQWTRDNGQFIPYPSTYLNQGRWQDEPEKSTDEHRPPNAQVWY